MGILVRVALLANGLFGTWLFGTLAMYGYQNQRWVATAIVTAFAVFCFGTLIMGIVKE